MIHFISISKSFDRPALPPCVVLRPSTLSVPAGRRVAVLGGRHQGKTTLLRLLAGAIRPDAGRIIGAESLSPVVNDESLLHPRLTGLDNLRFIARAYGYDVETLLMAVDTLCPVDFPLDQPLKAHDKGRRRILEAAIVMVLPFRCFLFDDAGQFEDEQLRDFMGVAAARQAGFIFATAQGRFALRHADSAITIDDGVLRLFDHVEDAVQAFDGRRQP